MAMHGAVLVSRTCNANAMCAPGSRIFAEELLMLHDTGACKSSTTALLYLLSVASTELAGVTVHTQTGPCK